MNVPQRQLFAILRGDPAGTDYGAEIGVDSGDTSAFLLRRFPRLRLFMVDPWVQPDKSSEYFRSADGCARQSQACFDRAFATAMRQTHFARRRRIVIRMPSPAAAKMISHYLDFVYIDAEHTYSGCLADMDAWYPKLHPGGILCGHDYNYRSPRFAVPKAVDEFAKEHGLKIEVGKGSVWWARKP